MRGSAGPQPYVKRAEHSGANSPVCVAATSSAMARKKRNKGCLASNPPPGSRREMANRYPPQWSTDSESPRSKKSPIEKQNQAIQKLTLGKEGNSTGKPGQIYSWHHSLHTTH